MRAGERGAAEIRSEYIDLLDAKYSVKHDKMVVRTVGVPQDRLQNVLSDCKRISGEKLLYNVYQCDGEMRLELLYDSNSPKMLIDDVMRVAVQGLNDYIYAVEDTPLNERVFEDPETEGIKTRNCRILYGRWRRKKTHRSPRREFRALRKRGCLRQSRQRKTSGRAKIHAHAPRRGFRRNGV